MSTAIARKMDLTDPEGEDILANLTAADRAFLRGVEETARQLEEAGMLTPSAERLALYGGDPVRELDDIEAGRHPIVERLRRAYAAR